MQTHPWRNFFSAIAFGLTVEWDCCPACPPVPCVEAKKLLKHFLSYRLFSLAVPLWLEEMRQQKRRLQKLLRGFSCTPLILSYLSSSDIIWQLKLLLLRRKAFITCWFHLYFLDMLLSLTQFLWQCSPTPTVALSVIFTLSKYDNGRALWLVSFWDPIEHYS